MVMRVILSVADPLPEEEMPNLGVSPNPVSSATVVTGQGVGDLTVSDAAGRTVFSAQTSCSPLCWMRGSGLRESMRCVLYLAKTSN